MPTLVLAASRFMMSEQESRRPNPDENEFPVFILLLFCVRVCFPLLSDHFLLCFSDIERIFNPKNAARRLFFLLPKFN